jgi:hypothetical protein
MRCAFCDKQAYKEIDGWYVCREHQRKVDDA